MLSKVAARSRYLCKLLLLGLVLDFLKTPTANSCPAGPSFNLVGNANTQKPQVLSVENLLELKKSNPQAFEKLLKEEPGYVWVLKDLEFAELEKMPGGIRQALWKKYSDDIEKAEAEYGAYLRRKNWREQNWAETRPLPGYPGGPRRTEVDKILKDPYLPPTNKVSTPNKKILVSDMKVKDTELKVYFEPGIEKVNVYDASNARVAAFEYNIRMDDSGAPTVLKVSIAAVDPDFRGLQIADALYKKVLDYHPEIKSLEGSLAYTNAKIFWTEFAKTKSYIEAVKATPAYKSRVKLGFSNIEMPKDFPPEDWDPRSWDYETQIPLVTTRAN